MNLQKGHLALLVSLASLCHSMSLSNLLLCPFYSLPLPLESLLPDFVSYSSSGAFCLTFYICPPSVSCVTLPRATYVLFILIGILHYPWCPSSLLPLVSPFSSTFGVILFTLCPSSHLCPFNSLSLGILIFCHVYYAFWRWNPSIPPIVYCTLQLHIVLYHCILYSAIVYCT